MENRKRILKGLMSLFLTVVLLIMPLANMQFKAEAATGTVTVRFHYSRTDGSYDSWYVWGWPKNEAGAWYSFSERDGNGSAVATVAGVASSTASFGFLITTKDWTKDYSSDRYVDLSDVSTGVVDVYLTAGNAGFTRTVSASGYILSNARVSAEKQISVDWSSEQSTVPSLSVYDVTTSRSRNDVVSIEKTGSTGMCITFSEKVYVGHEYKITYGTNSETVIAKVNYDSDYFKDNLTYSGDDLGSTYSSGSTIFKVWAPTADELSVMLFDEGSVEKNSKCIGTYNMTGGGAAEKGVWSVTISGDLKNMYYVYKVKNADNTNYCMDPYAVTGCTTNDNAEAYKTSTTAPDAISSGQRSMVTDLNSTDPAAWNIDSYVITESKTDASVYEVSIRDFSSDAESGITAANQMKYLAFTEKGTTLRNEGTTSTGIDYIKNLGVSYVQIMPSYDFLGTDEVTLNNYNWGYNPVNYNIPEGAFSSNPYDGNTRVNEYKQMVQAIHNEDMGVIMDVVYNHVNSQSTFCFEQLVPGYFFRGSNGSGCGNDVASERTMVRKYIVDSVTYWANEYHIDGFRFDLVGLLDVETMNQVRAALDEINPGILVYGEGWTLSTSTVESVDLATQTNTNKMSGVGMFNDVIRSAIRGGNDSTSRGYATGDFSSISTLKSAIMANTWFTNDPTQIINYISCHDNYTLWDKIQASTSWAWESTQANMNKLAAAINITSQGIPLFQAGEEFLRTKGGDENSYKSSDAVNMLDWSLAEDNADVAAYYAGLLKFRNNHAGLRMDTRTEIDSKLSYLTTTDNIIAYTIDGSAEGEVADKILVAFNPNLGNKTLTLPSGEWKVCVNGEKAGTDVIAMVSGTVTLTEYSAFILVQGKTEEEKKPEELGITGYSDKSACKVGENVILTAKPEGGSGNYTYGFLVYNVSTDSWYRFNSGSKSNTYTWSPGSEGTRRFYIEVTDATGKTVRSEAIEVSVSASAQSLSAGLQASASSVTKGDTVTFTASSTYGTGDYTYKFIIHNKDTSGWFILRDFSSDKTLAWTAGSNGNREVFVDVKDSTGKIVRSNAIAISVVDSSELRVSTAAGTSLLSKGESVLVAATAEGGSGNYTYKFIIHNTDTDGWFLLKDFSAASTFIWTAGSTGNREIFVDVKDITTGVVTRSNAVNVSVK